MKVRSVADEIAYCFPFLTALKKSRGGDKTIFILQYLRYYVMEQRSQGLKGYILQFNCFNWMKMTWNLPFLFNSAKNSSFSEQGRCCNSWWIAFVLTAKCAEEKIGDKRYMQVEF
ncbi:hypothetical protein LOAG_10569 [Loa loa]|uniref:Uncharacterized protein n=1 Tax=Loa loa TaxID=7209 RepID=A0A1S0TR67_LOALO|nr:hypothetical protein LOAG_10569 [Loa loa]EFO17929.1 hypothetical protein LOAG_10569 [Loa loa]